MACNICGKCSEEERERAAASEWCLSSSIPFDLGRSVVPARLIILQRAWPYTTNMY